MKKYLSPLAVALCLAFTAHAQEVGLLPNASFETAIEDRPKGWRVFPSPPETTGEFYVADGTEGQTTRTGIGALQFFFPEGGDIAQCVWMADPIHGGVALEPGRYSCSFWVKAEDLQEGFHTWLSIIGFGPDNARIGDIGRSDYLDSQDLLHDEWTRVRFSFEVTPESGVARVAPTVVFKTNANASVNPVPPTTRVIYDDVELTKD